MKKRNHNDIDGFRLALTYNERVKLHLSHMLESSTVAIDTTCNVGAHT